MRDETNATGALHEEAEEKVKLKEEPGWGMRTRKTMKSLGLTEGAALKDSLKQARLFREANGGPP